LIAAYVYWLEEEIVAEEAYSRCGTTRGPSRRRAFAVYFAALDREERAAAEYARCVDELSVIISRGDHPSSIAVMATCDRLGRLVQIRICR
jgi:hypothetical protein